LNQVACFIGIAFIAARKPHNHGAISLGQLPIAVVAAHSFTMHETLVGTAAEFLHFAENNFLQCPLSTHNGHSRWVNLDPADVQLRSPAAAMRFAVSSLHLFSSVTAAG
jgi:hypothetical protein